MLYFELKQKTPMQPCCVKITYGESIFSFIETLRKSWLSEGSVYLFAATQKSEKSKQTNKHPSAFLLFIVKKKHQSQFWLVMHKVFALWFYTLLFQQTSIDYGHLLTLLFFCLYHPFSFFFFFFLSTLLYIALCQFLSSSFFFFFFFLFN